MLYWMQYMQNSAKIKGKRVQNPLFYVTRDVERALGWQGSECGQYCIITNASPLATHAAETLGNRILQIQPRNGTPRALLSTRELLMHPDTRRFIGVRAEGQVPCVVVFKNTTQIEHVCREQGWQLLNPPSSLAEEIENKISQVALFDTMAHECSSRLNFPPFMVGISGELSYGDLAKGLGLPFIVQYNRAHTGDGTLLIRNSFDWHKVQAKFPLRDVKVSAFITGTPLTVNVCAFENGSAMVGCPSVQITGIPELTALPQATVGNDWSAFFSFYDVGPQIESVSLDVGRFLANKGWRGLFGIDFILSSEGRELYMLEINARQAASAVCESQMQRLQMTDDRLQSNNTPLSLMDAHLAALMEGHLGSEILSLKSSNVKSGSQIFVRNNTLDSVQMYVDLNVGEYSEDLIYQEHARSVADIRDNNFFVIPKTSGLRYQPNDELARIQSRQGMTDARGQLLPHVSRFVKQVKRRIEMNCST